MKALDVLTDVRDSFAAKVVAIAVAIALIVSCFSIPALAFAAGGYEPVANVGIYPNNKPSGNTATGKIRQSGQSLTMKVGQKASFLLGAPTNTLVGSVCKHTIAVYDPSDYCDISLIDNSGMNLVGNPTYAAGNNNGSRVFDTIFDALKPGTSSDVRVCYYTNFGIVLANGANSAYVRCPRCSKNCLVYKDVTWYRYNDVFGITVNADYALNYDTQGGSDVAATTATVASTTSALKVTSAVPTKEGYKFQGWAETESGAVKYKADDSITLNWSEGYGSEANPVGKTLYAVWKEANPDEVTYRIDREYWINGEKIATVTGTTENATAGDEIAGADLDAANTGWRTRRVEGEKRTFDYTGSTPETLTLSADGTNVITLKYEINDVVEKTYTVVYKDGANGDAFGDESHGNLKEGDDTPAFEGSTARTGYTFQGWTPAVKSSVDSNMANDDGEIIYTATWLKNERKITVTWKDGYTDDPIKVEKVKKGILDEELEELYPADPERDGYAFNGWGDPETDEDGNITITAKWKKGTTETPKEEPVGPGTEDPDPVDPDPVDPDPVDPVDPDPVDPDPVNPDPVNPDPVNPDPENPTPVDPEPTPGTDEPTVETPEPEPTTPEAPNTPVETEATPNAPAEGTAPTAAVAIVPAAAASETPAEPVATVIDENANPLAGITPEGIFDDGNPLGAFDLPHCWVHWLMIIGMVLTAVYGAVVLIRRKKFTDDNNKFEKSVLGKDKETEKVYAPLGSQQAI